MDHDAAMLTMTLPKCLLNRLRVLQRQSMSSLVPHFAPSSSRVSTSPCHHMTVRLVYPIDQRVIAESPISFVPQTSVSFLEHQSDTPETRASLVWIGTLCRRLIASPCPKPVFLVSKCFRYGQISSDLLMSPKGSVVQFRQWHAIAAKASLVKRSTSCRNHSS